LQSIRAILKTHRFRILWVETGTAFHLLNHPFALSATLSKLLRRIERVQHGQSKQIVIPNNVLDDKIKQTAAQIYATMVICCEIVSLYMLNLGRPNLNDRAFIVGPI
jgi:hypothetical protein